MKIKNFSIETHKKIQKILNKNHFVVYNQDNYHLDFGNDKIIIETYTSERGDEAGFIIRDKNSNRVYYMFNIAQQILGDKWKKYDQFMNEDDVKVMYKLDNTTEGGFYSFFTILENYCDEIIEGNFEIMHGENSEFVYGMHRFK